MQQLPAAATAASQAQLLSPTGQLQAVHHHQPAAAAAVQTQQALQQDPNDPNKWHVVQVATAAAPQGPNSIEEKMFLLLQGGPSGREPGLG